ncbi:hypothetical protein FQZ97_648340 [compost metagenome]
MAFQQICIPEISNIPIIALLFSLIATALLASKTAKLKGDKLLIVAYFLAITSYMISVIESPDKISTLSFLYFLVIYLIFFISPKNPRQLISKIPNIGILFCLAGIGQSLFQSFGLSFYDVRNIFPEDFILAGYNYSYETNYGSGIYKSNGFTLLEPSFFSQFLAIFFIIEVHNKKRLHFLAAFSIGILTSYSGTGFMILGSWLIGLFLTSSIGLGRKLIIISFATIGPLTLFLTNEYLLNRIAEFNNQGSSAHIRFIATFLNYFNLLGQLDILGVMFGAGPGISDRMQLGNQANYPALIKALMEYGVLFSLTYLAWWMITIKRMAQPSLRLPIFTLIFITSGSFLQPLTLFTAWILLFFSEPTNQDAIKSSQSMHNEKLRLAQR